ncbi:MAG: ABC transporter substrate-binding protein [Candidatus Pacebacteria bacterium]|nr:ABC transporter substrate-binding protein [Candidatus Paceibacterota bacterium]
MKQLNYVITQSQSHRSCDPKDSDYSPNAVHMRQLTGTLLKFNAVNTFVPRLAESWSTEQNGLVWTFKVRPGFHCEDATEITSNLYKEGLELAFRNHAPSPDTPAFSLLSGWKEFISGTSATISGIQTPDKHTLRFEFSAFPSGLEAYLAMPYFGFYCRSNFDEKGKWKNREKIISSGPYQLERFDNDKNEIVLRKREDWPSNLESSPDRISIKAMQQSNAIEAASTNTIIEFLPVPHQGTPKNWTLLRGAITISANLILNYRRALFSDRDNRLAFARIVRAQLKKEENSLQWAKVSSSFFPFVAAQSRSGNTPEDTARPNWTDKVFNVEDAPLDSERAILIDKILRESINQS